MVDISCSLVIYKNEKGQLLNAINSFLNTKLNVKLILIDNSPTDELKSLCLDQRVEYIFNPTNPGFGTSHNIGILKLATKSKYHLILNPDIYFEINVLDEIIKFMDKYKHIGLVMPKILYPDGTTQYLAKLLPSPLTFFVRRILRNLPVVGKYFASNFDLKFSGYNKIFEAPYLSGCFMVFRSEVLLRINGFDQNYFMHMEDLDISRRILQAGYKNIFFPSVFVYHDHIYKSTLEIKSMKMYLKSAIYYFNKWGWFFDKNRSKFNKNCIQSIKKNSMD